MVLYLYTFVKLSHFVLYYGCHNNIHESDGTKQVTEEKGIHEKRSSGEV